MAGNKVKTQNIRTQ